MGSPKGLRLLATFEVAELFKQGIFFVAKDVIQVQETWYGQAMEVARAINDYPMGPSEIHKSFANYSTPEYNSHVATHKPKANEPTGNTRSLAAEAFHTNTNMNQNYLFDAVHSRNNTGVFTSSEVADAVRDEMCTFVIPQLKKVKMTRPEEP